MLNKYLPEKMRLPALVVLCSTANMINAADRVIMPIAIVGLAKQYKYTLVQQGWILGAFPIGYISSQLVGSCAGAQFGGRRLLAFVVLLWSLSTLLTPLVAHSFHFLVICRIILGLGEGLGLPTIYHILAQSISTDQRSSAFSYLNAFGSIGQTFAAVICPLVEWWLPFYLFGFLGIIWCIVWQRQDHDIIPSLSDQLLLCNQNPSLLIRIRRFFTSWSLWSIYIAHFTMNWTSYIVMHWLPTYLSHTLHANPSDLSFACVPYLANSLCSIGVGHLADRLISEEKISLIRVRKLMTCLGLVIPGLLLFWFSAITNVYTAVLLISLVMGALALNSAGHLSNHADVCPKFAGISFAISNTIATIPGVAAGPLTAEIVTQSSGRWFPVFILAGCMNFVGSIVYISHASVAPVFN